MRPYFSYFKKEILVGLQYKSAALAGITTQFFWGVLYAFVYASFYSHTQVDSINFKELMCYVWLNQALFSLIVLPFNRKEITEQIRNGNVAYELCRPYDLYWWWYIKHLASRYASCALRFLPVIIVAFILPKPYGLSLPISFSAFVMFIIAVFFFSLIITSIVMIITIITFFTYNDKGISSIIYIVGGLLSGFDIPLPLMPRLLLIICEYLPFRLIGDLANRVYSGNINFSYGLKGIVLQITWLIILIIIGRILMNTAIKKVSIQGG